MRRESPHAGRSVSYALILATIGSPLHGQVASGSTGPDLVADAFSPDTVVAPPVGPRIVRLPTPGASVVSMRLFIPLREGPAEAGAARILQVLGTESAQAVASQVGARVQGSRTPWGIAYTVTGATSDADFLAFTLRNAVSDPAGRRVDFGQAVDALEAEVERQQETPGGRVAAQLRSQAAPSSPPLGGTPGSLGRLTLADVRGLWARTHQAEHMTLVVAGDVPLEVLLASFQSIGAPSSGAVGPSEAPVSEPSRPAPQVIRHWFGEARLVSDASDPRAEVAALLVARSLEASGGRFEAEVQLWQLPEAKVLAIVGAAYSQGRQEMVGRVQSAVSATATALTESAVGDAVSEIRTDLLMGARTPPGRASLVGLLMEASGEATAAADLLRRLDAVTIGSIRTFLEGLAGTTPLRAEVRP